MGYKKWGKEIGLADLAVSKPLEPNRSLNIMMSIDVYLAEPDVKIAAELCERSTSVPVNIIPEGSAHETILKLHGRSRVSIGLSISDAISTSLLEAMVMGSFPIQSCTSCADEWIVDGETGILVPPEDPEVVEMAIRRALTDDHLVNGAADNNFRVAEERLDWRKLKEMAIGMYNRVVHEGGRRERRS